VRSLVSVVVGLNFLMMTWCRRLEEVTSQLNDLRASLHPDTSHSPTTSAASSGLNQVQDHSPHKNDALPSVSDDEEGRVKAPTSSGWLQIDPNEETSSRCLEMIILTPETTVDLLQQ